MRGRADRRDARPTPATSPRSRGLVRRQAEVCEHGDHERFAVLDDEFHAAICELAGHSVAWEVAQRVKGHLNRVRRLSLPQPRYLEEMVAEHGLVLEALAQGDPDAAEAALRHHLRMVLSALPAIRERAPRLLRGGAR